MTRTALAEAAATLGVPVFACGPDKKPLTPRGLYDATAESATIRRMFAQPRATMIGTPTGRASGVIVIDIDVKEGRDGTGWLAENAHALPETRTHRTRSGGMHLLFAVPDGVEIRNSASRIAPGADVRGEGGYVIVPPSPGYEVVDRTEPAAMPRWLVKACLPPPPPPPPPRPTRACSGSPDSAARRLLGLVGFVATAPDGRRNEALYWAACRAAEAAQAGELSRGAAAAALEEAAREAGLPLREAQRTIGSAFRRIEA